MLRLVVAVSDVTTAAHREPLDELDERDHLMYLPSDRQHRMLIICQSRFKELYRLQMRMCIKFALKGEVIDFNILLVKDVHG